MSPKILIVLKHEFLQKFRSRAYIILTLTGPILMGALFVIPAFFASFNQADSRTYAVVDETGVLARYFEQPDSASKASLPKDMKFVGVASSNATASTDSLRRLVQQDSLTGVITIRKDAISSMSASSAVLRTKNTNDFTANSAVERIYKGAIRQERLKAQGVDPALIAKVQDIPDIEALKVSEKSDARDEGGTFIAGYITGFIIYMSMLLYGQTIMRSVIEEKGSRVIEVIVSSIRPIDLLIGKVLGNALAAFLQVTVWAIMLALLATLGVSALQTAMGQSLHMNVPPSSFIYFVVYFVFGFLIYSTLYAAVGATVDQESDAQQASMPIMLLVIVPIMTLASVIQAPSSTMSVVMSMIPFFSPVLMMGRIFSETPPFWQIALSLILMAGTFFGVLWIAARIYRVGILMYGKKFSLSEIAKWVRFSA